MKANLKKTLKKILRIREYSPSKKFLVVPGMIDFNERMNLYKCARNLYKGNGNIVEFGAFFGSSAACLAAGINDGNYKHVMISNESNCNLHVYDVFRAPKKSQFADFVYSFAKESNQQELLKINDEWVDFEDIFNVNLSKFNIKPVVHKSLISAVNWSHGDIEILHLDLPKDWPQAKKIAEETFTSVIKGGFILFQDFVYHWSSDLIALVGFLLSKNIIEVVKIDGSTLTTKVIKRMSKNDLSELNVQMNNNQYLENFNIADKETYEFQNLHAKNTLLIAKSVYIYTNGDQNKAMLNIAKVLNSIRIKDNIDIYDKENYKSIEEVLLYNFVMPPSWE